VIAQEPASERAVVEVQELVDQDHRMIRYGDGPLVILSLGTLRTPMFVEKAVQDRLNVHKS
jgi:hypothetical protein